MIPLWSIPMATVTGNTLILKPSERDPGAAMIIAELCQRAGLPPGVINVVHGTVPTVNAICDHPNIKAISFVGGDRAGKHIYERYWLPFKPVPTLVDTHAIAGQRMANGSNQTWAPKTMPFLCQMVWRGYIVQVHQLIRMVS
jgi:Aldehyde dehydrogenase family